MPAAFAINDEVLVTVEGQESVVRKVTMVQGVTPEGLIYEPTHPSVVFYQYVLDDGLAYTEHYLGLV